MSQKLRNSARSISSALGIAEASNLAALRDCALATAEVLDGFIENAVGDQKIIDELVRGFSQIAEGQRTVIDAHCRLNAFGRKLGLDPGAWGDCVPYSAVAGVPGGLHSVEAA